MSSYVNNLAIRRSIFLANDAQHDYHVIASIFFHFFNGKINFLHSNKFPVEKNTVFQGKIMLQIFIFPSFIDDTGF
jgi:hypothetical protein